MKRGNLNGMEIMGEGNKESSVAVEALYETKRLVRTRVPVLFYFREQSLTSDIE
ncbi:hypothetical protein X777_13455 [Ooceraea biroi]|uniref:Uncharacterized protein n=1 Tax=Ooceraea biroi TaxID=2015173 RepID=A0A026WX92_OOCBI|nr:hypothetical protein X777_13455 [Ooceraea biroi]